MTTNRRCDDVYHGVLLSLQSQPFLHVSTELTSSVMQLLNILYLLSQKH